MASSEDDIALAAEYALGTLDAEERSRAEALMADDAEFAQAVAAWELRLGVLNQMVGSIEPPHDLWERIRAVVAPAGSQHAISVAAPVVAAAADGGNVIDMTQRLRRWRGVAVSTSALAAGLAAFVAVQAMRPDMLPVSFRPRTPAQSQVAQAPAPETSRTPSPQYVALLQRDGNSPAFILTVDPGAKTFAVRRVDAAPPSGQSYELWLVSDRLPKPRSLGLIGGSDFTMRPEMASYDSDMMSKATYAVTVEPEGGSPTGTATGPIVFTGKLIETVPTR